MIPAHFKCEFVPHYGTALGNDYYGRPHLVFQVPTIRASDRVCARSRMSLAKTLGGETGTEGKP
jgi:hypothetical protein